MLLLGEVLDPGPLVGHQVALGVVAVQAGCHQVELVVCPATDSRHNVVDGRPGGGRGVGKSKTHGFVPVLLHVELDSPVSGSGVDLQLCLG